MRPRRSAAAAAVGASCSRAAPRADHPRTATSSRRRATYTWLGLPDGHILGTATIPLASASDPSLATSGLLVTTSGRGVVVPGLEDAFLTPSARWDGERVYALRTSEPRLEEIHRIDACAVMTSGTPRRR